jgi:hypothetical protein
MTSLFDGGRTARLRNARLSDDRPIRFFGQLGFAAKAEFDLNNLRINVDNYEEWDYLNPAFNDKLLTRKAK